MKKLALLSTVVVAAALTGCVTNQHLTHDQQCAEFQRQIMVLKQPNSGYTWQSAQYRINQIEHQADSANCKAQQNKKA